MREATAPTGEPRGRRVSPAALVSLALVAATLAVYHGVLRADFVYDDDQYLLQRAHLTDGLTWENVRWAFTTFYASNWHPLAWISHLADISLFGLEPAGHHAVNLALHALNAVLLFHALRGFTGALRRSALAAALFALHPLHVESAAWVAERKDLLSAALFLLALGAYRRYVREPGRARHAAVVSLFALGLLAKPMVVTLPFVLLLLDFWPLGRLRPVPASPGGIPARRLLLEKIPLLLLAAASSAVTVAAQRAGSSVVNLEQRPLADRLANAAVSYALYLGDTLLPADLIVPYALPEHGHPSWQVAGSAVLLVLLTAAALLPARRRPWLATGWLWYVGMLIPVIGIVQVGLQSRADRYTYLPLVGVFVAALWEAHARTVARGTPARAVLPPAAAALLAFSLLAHRQAGHWKDQRALFTHTRAVTRDSVVAAINIAAQAKREGRLEEATGLYLEALRMSPGFFEATYGLGTVLALQGQADGAAAHFRAALHVRPDAAEAWFNLGALEARRGRREEAIAAYRSGLKLEPGTVDGHMNLGNALSDSGRVPEALEAYAEAVRLAPKRADVFFNRGLALERAGRLTEAARDYREALRNDPAYQPAVEGAARLSPARAPAKGFGAR